MHCKTMDLKTIHQQCTQKTPLKVHYSMFQKQDSDEFELRKKITLPL